jgi:TrmH family RNA methyltransferase
MLIGRHSRKLVELRKAIRQGAMTSGGLLPIEGPILIEEALRSGVEVADVFVQSGRALLPKLDGRQAYEVPPDVFATLQETEHSQGVIAAVRPPQFELTDIARTEPALILVLARLQDPGNAGAILRIGEAFGATGCVALPGTVHLYNGKAVRASAGSIFRLPHVESIRLDEIINVLKARHIRVVGTAPGAKTTIDEWDWRGGTAVLIGNEGGGLNAEELKACETVMRIPHSPTVQSLNSAITAAVILYEASKQRGRK